MREPRCEICGSREMLNTLQFADYQPLADGARGHPRGVGYFCLMHDASGLTHLSMGEAIRELRAGRGGPGPSG